MPTYPQSAYDFVDRTKDVLNCRWPFVLRPSGWTSFTSTVQFNWQKVKFDDHYVNLVPDDKIGIYSFVVEPGIANHPGCSYLLYIGMTEKQSFRIRYKQYLKEPFKPKPRPRIVRMLMTWPEHLYFYYAPLSAGIHVATVEKQLIDAYWPPVNRDLPAGVQAISGGIFG